MKLSEYIGDLQSLLDTYGDGAVVEENGPTHGFTAVRSARLRVIVSRNAADTHVEVDHQRGQGDTRPRCYVI